MPKVQLCVQCDEPVDEDRQRYMDVTERAAGLEEWQVAYVHFDCYPEWKKENVGTWDEK
jgi:hypothetical protein